jgi:ADP-ribose pyrophosphatase YjhB (NUDIX family)
MSKDILFKTEDFVFSYRVGGLLIHNNKILLQRPKNDDFAIVGGHVSCLETTTETLKREFEEEIHAKIEVDNLLAVGEIFFPWGKKPCHQICLYYRVHLLNENDIPLEGIFHGYDEMDNKKIDLDFCWIPLEELKNGLKVYPLELIPHILSNANETVHFISKQI